METDDEPLMTKEGPLDGEVQDVEIELGRPAGGLIPEGPALFRIKKIDLKSGPSGYGYLKAEFRAEQGEAAGMALWDNLSLSPEARFRLNAFLDALDLPRTGKMRTSALLDRPIFIDVKHEDWEGEARAKVGKYLNGPTSAGSESVAKVEQAITPRKRAKAKLGSEFD